MCGCVVAVQDLVFLCVFACFSNVDVFVVCMLCVVCLLVSVLLLYVFVSGVSGCYPHDVFAFVCSVCVARVLC